MQYIWDRAIMKLAPFRVFGFGYICLRMCEGVCAWVCVCINV